MGKPRRTRPRASDLIGGPRNRRAVRSCRSLKPDVRPESSCARGVEMPLLKPRAVFPAGLGDPHAHASRMVDSVRDGRVDPDIAELAQAFDAERVNPIVRFGNENDVDRLDVRVHRDQIVGEIGVDISPCALVQLRRLVESGAQTPDDPAHELAARCPRVHDFPGGEGAERPRNSDLARTRMHAHLNELRAKREGELISLRAARHRNFARIEPLNRLRRQGSRDQLGVFFQHRLTHLLEHRGERRRGVAYVHMPVGERIVGDRAIRPFAVHRCGGLEELRPDRVGHGAAGEGR